MFAESSVFAENLGPVAQELLQETLEALSSGTGSPAVAIDCVFLLRQGMVMMMLDHLTGAVGVCLQIGAFVHGTSGYHSIAATSGVGHGNTD